MAMPILRGVAAGPVVLGVTEVSGRYPKLGTLLLTLWSEWWIQNGAARVRWGRGRNFAGHWRIRDG